jgi:hypothetical protein
VNTLLTIGGGIAILSGAICLLYGAAAFCGWCAFIVRWKWGNARQMQRSVRLGWNAGMPPEGQWFFVREWADRAKCKYMGGCPENYDWALMRRKGDQCVSINRGFQTPVTNINGWMYVDQPSILNSVKQAPGGDGDA